MTGLALQILEPAHGAYVADADPVHLRGTLAAGDPAGLFFKWYSTLHRGATASHPELNLVHGAASLAFAADLDVGSHVITLAAADQEGGDLAAVQAITRAAVTGGAPDPHNPAPRVVHRLLAVLNRPVAGATLARAGATVEFRAPARWSLEDPLHPGSFVPDPDYRALHAIQVRFELRPTGGPDPAHTASVVVDLAAAEFFVEGSEPYLRWQGALPAQLLTGPNVLTLFVEKPDRSVQHAASCQVNLSP